ncbi:hypothetical protein K0I63_03660 [Shewanella rhizosphaerae]|uniref:hypothetical protein n=1 Tax=Shewanella rhizosphaerae TaxID=2864207 RepID=UPI001C65B882|nr:hypothetical protein [Shewanella rhizosphaerae]QYK13625.1 hypothetical protein K0I63_03660 [Shewanella rhizosphaerae]
MPQQANNKFKTNPKQIQNKPKANSKQIQNKFKTNSKQIQNKFKTNIFKNNPLQKQQKTINIYGLTGYYPPFTFDICKNNNLFSIKEYVEHE